METVYILDDTTTKPKQCHDVLYFGQLCPGVHVNYDCFWSQCFIEGSIRFQFITFTANSLWGWGV